MTDNFRPTFRIRSTESNDSVILEVSDPAYPSDFIPLVKDGIDVACYEIMEVYNAVYGDARFFRDWEHAQSFYENERWFGDDEVDIDFDNDEFGWTEVEDG